MTVRVIGDIKLYTADIRDFSDAEYQKWYSLMDSDKQRRVDSFRFYDDKKRTVSGEMLARTAVADMCGIAPGDIKFAAGEKGKPYALAQTAEFNISHSENMVICAASSLPVGVDIEKIRPVNLKTAKQFCSDDELLCLFGHKPSENEFTAVSEGEILKRFFRLWTKKEAYGKFTGEGLFFKNTDAECDEFFIEDAEGYIIAVCTAKNKGQ